jgi:peroxin-6
MFHVHCLFSPVNAHSLKGKTLVAKAVARECGLPFLSIKGPELLGSYVGESEANIRAVFEAARSAAAASTVTSHHLDSDVGGERTAYSGAAVLFFDELDSLAPRRGETGHGDGVMERVVATLLSELDSGSSNCRGSEHLNSTKSNLSPSIIVIGATNRPDLLDPSLLRPGRFDRLLYLGPAQTKEACLQILLAQTRKFKFQDGSDRNQVLISAMKSFPPTLSGADLSAVASGALMRALKRVCDSIEDKARQIKLNGCIDEISNEEVDVNIVMESLTDEQLQPVLSVDDFTHAAKDIVPSINEEDLRRFEMLRQQFSAIL